MAPYLLHHRADHNVELNIYIVDDFFGHLLNHLNASPKKAEALCHLCASAKSAS